MSWCDRRQVVALIATAAAGCGFRPLYGEGSAAKTLIGSVFLPEARDPITFAFRDRCAERLGEGDEGGRWRLESLVTIEEVGSATTQAADVTRFRLTGAVEYALIDQTREDAEPMIGRVESLTAYDASATPFATRVARQDAERRLARTLADLTVTQLLGRMTGPDAPA